MPPIENWTSSQLHASGIIVLERQMIIGMPTLLLKSDGPTDVVSCNGLLLIINFQTSNKNQCYLNKKVLMRRIQTPFPVNAACEQVQCVTTS
jgi:hypothetical protein